MRRLFGLLLPLALVACSGGQDEAAQQEAAGPDSVEVALAAYSPALFDSITWKADTAQVNRGAVVWMYSCAKCHGETGTGDGGFVQNGDTLRPPSFHAPDWRFASDRAELMKYIFAGNNEGMPHWGLVGLKPRDIDAVAAYIQQGLRSTAAPQPGS